MQILVQEIWGGGLRFCISNKLLGDPDAAQGFGGAVGPWESVST